MLNSTQGKTVPGRALAHWQPALWLLVLPASLVVKIGVDGVCVYAQLLRSELAICISCLMALIQGTFHWRETDQLVSDCGAESTQPVCGFVEW